MNLSFFGAKEDGSSGGMQGLLQSPALNMGAGLLQHRADPNSMSVPQALLSGLATSEQAKKEEEEREKAKKYQEALQSYFHGQMQQGQQRNPYTQNDMMMGGYGQPAGIEPQYLTGMEPQREIEPQYITQVGNYGGY